MFQKKHLFATGNECCNFHILLRLLFLDQLIFIGPVFKDFSWKAYFLFFPFPTIQTDAPLVVSGFRRCLECNTFHGSLKVAGVQSTKTIFLSLRMLITSDGHVTRRSVNHQGDINIHEMLLDFVMLRLNSYMVIYVNWLVDKRSLDLLWCVATSRSDLYLMWLHVPTSQ